MEKLVRDDVLQRCLDDPLVTTTYRTLEGDDYVRELIRKIHEEADEIPVRDRADDEILSELADLQEALDAIKETYGLSSADIRTAMDRKAEKSGRFALKAYIEYVELADGSEWIDYFRRFPDKYPETT